MIKKTFKYLLKAVKISLLLIGVYLLCVLLLPFIPHSADKNQDEEITIYIKSNGMHTDLVLPINTATVDWRQYVKLENTQANDSMAKYVAMGWGDKGFYLETPTWGDLKFSTAFKAAFWLGSSALHATFYKSLEEDELTKKVNISRVQYKRLAHYIKATFYLENGQSINIKTNANYGAYDAFYEAKGTYSIFKTCNTWANTALKKAGCRAALWTATDKGIFRHYN